MIPGGHRDGKVAEHKCCYGGTWYIMLEEEEMKKTLGELTITVGFTLILHLIVEFAITLHLTAEFIMTF